MLIVAKWRGCVRKGRRKSLRTAAGGISGSVCEVFAPKIPCFLLMIEVKSIRTCFNEMSLVSGMCSLQHGLSGIKRTARNEPEARHPIGRLQVGANRLGRLDYRA